MAGLPGAGRPELPEREKRKVYIMVRLTEEEKQLVQKVAKMSRRNPSELARSVILQYCDDWQDAKKA